jgi:acyl-CoA synthetase (AMP-forming)/AMP-acid ligase II
LRHNFEKLLSVPPDKIVYDWIGRDGTSQKSLTAGVLRQHALDEAQRLSKTTHKDAIIGIATNSGPDFLIGLIGCIYAGRTALPLPGTRPGPGRKRLLDAITAIKPSIILVTAAEINQLREPAAQIGAELQVIGTADFCNVEPDFGIDPKISILQFTSGTTGAAKAISLSSSAILANAKFTASAYGV